MEIVFNKQALEYQGTLGEKNRIIYAYDYLKGKYNFIDYKDKIKKPFFTEDKIISKIKKENFINFDSPAYHDVYDFAINSVNGAIKAQEIQGFALIDPPGHHAAKDYFGGFCYFNNLAEAVYHSKLKTLIIDIDGHHGNGTQDIFEGNENVFFISLHQTPNYPGTGFSSDKNYLNFPLVRDCGEEIYVETLKKAIREALKIFSPEQIAVSAGFDTYNNDLASLGLEKSSYKKIAKVILGAKNKTNSRLFAVLEGGYKQNLGELIEVFVREL